MFYILFSILSLEDVYFTFTFRFIPATFQMGQQSHVETTRQHKDIEFLGLPFMSLSQISQSFCFSFLTWMEVIVRVVKQCPQYLLILT